VDNALELSIAPADTVASLSDQTLQLLGAGIPEATRRAYAADRADWTHYTDGRGQPALPVDEMLLADYVATLLTAGNPRLGEHARPLKPSGIERRLSAIVTWSRERGYGTPELRGARLVLRGHRRTTPTRPTQAAPVTVAALAILLREAANTPDGPTSARALRDQALIGLGFALGARRSELVNVHVEHVQIQADGIVVQVHRAKTRDLPEAVAVPWADDVDLCAGRAVIRLRTRLVADGFQHGPLFRHIRRGDHVQHEALTPRAVADILKRVATRADLPVPDGFRGWSGHSLRRGFATEARRAGADALRIARHGGWADGSAALARYLVDVDRWEGHPLRGVL
jgi:integrase